MRTLTSIALVAAMREQAAQLLLTEPRAISIAQPIGTISLTRSGAVALVTGRPSRTVDETAS